MKKLLAPLMLVLAGCTSTPAEPPAAQTNVQPTEHLAAETEAQQPTISNDELMKVPGMREKAEQCKRENKELKVETRPVGTTGMLALHITCA